MADADDVDIPESLIRSIPGNASLEVKGLVRRWQHVFGSSGFGMQVARRLDLVEVSVVPSPNEPAKEETRVVLEITVNEDMVNPTGKLHGGCIAHLIDISTTLPVVALARVKGGRGSAGVSQSINVIYHAPANLGDKLRLVNTSTSMGRRLWSARVEVWDMTHHRLVASATQVKIEPSAPKL